MDEATLGEIDRGKLIGQTGAHVWLKPRLAKTGLPKNGHSTGDTQRFKESKSQRIKESKEHYCKYIITILEIYHKYTTKRVPQWAPYHPPAPPQSLQYQASRRQLNVRNSAIFSYRGFELPTSVFSNNCQKSI